MSRCVLVFSMSLDGFVAGPDVGFDLPMGRGGEALHEWMGSSDPIDVEAMQLQRQRPGAVILGRTTYDVGRPHWDGTPYPAPSFVLTSRDGEPDSGFAFVRSGIADALDEARSVAGDRDIVVMGASVARQFLSAGLVDELALQVVPLLLGSGEPLFDAATPSIPLEMVSARPSATVVHVTYRPGPPGCA